MSEWEVWSLLGSPGQRAAEQDTHREPFTRGSTTVKVKLMDPVK
jgi:hypothetical protein